MSKKNSDPEKIWKYIDEDLNQEESIQFEQSLRKDPNLQKEYHTRKKLDQSLKTIESTSPSMRFTANLMEKLAKVLPKTTIRPLISKFWIRAFQLLGLSFGLFLLCFLVLAVWNIFRSKESLTYPGSETINQLIGNSSSTFFIILGGISFAYILLSFIDNYFNRKKYLP